MYESCTDETLVAPGMGIIEGELCRCQAIVSANAETDFDLAISKITELNSRLTVSDPTPPNGDQGRKVTPFSSHTLRTLESLKYFGLRSF